MARFFSLVKLSVNLIRYYSSCIHVNEVYIISAVRTPIGSFQGALSSLTAVQLATKALTAAVEKAAICKEDVAELVLGVCLQTGLCQSPDRQIALCAGLPPSVITFSTNKLCASGLKAVMLGSQIISTMSQEVVAVVGAESCSNIPYMLKRKNVKVGNLCLHDLLLHDGLNDPFKQLDITHFAEETAKEFNVTREDQDNYALMSFERAGAALKNGFFEEELVPITIKGKDGKEVVICEDEERTRLKIDKFRHLPPIVGKGGTITVGNSSNINDGAAVLILASGNFVLKKGLKPLAKIVSYADASVHPKKFCLSPSVVIPKALVKANLTIDQICWWEISETFALTTTVNAQLLKLCIEQVNLHGGAISLGHPFGMTGVRLLVHLAHVMQTGELGCACMSHGNGGGSTVIIQKL